MGIIPATRLDEIPSYRQDWMNTSTMKTTEQMKDAKSVIVLGYHASDDIYEARAVEYVNSLRLEMQGVNG